MDDIVKAAEKLLVHFPPDSITFVETGPGEAHGMPGAVTGSFRTNNRALMVPIAESGSMMATFPSTVEFFTEAPGVISGLLALVKSQKGEKVEEM